MSLPDMTGLDVARALRAIPGTKDALIAMHTALGNEIFGRSNANQTSRARVPVQAVTPEKLDTILSHLNVLLRRR
jgi:hypothetical protein